MLDAEDQANDSTTAPEIEGQVTDPPPARAPAKKAAVKRSTTKRTAKKATAKDLADVPAVGNGTADAEAVVPAKRSTRSTSAAKKATAKRTSKKAAETPEFKAAVDTGTGVPEEESAPASDQGSTTGAPPPPTMLLFQPPEPTKAPPRRKKSSRTPATETDRTAEGSQATASTDPADTAPADTAPADRSSGSTPTGDGPKSSTPPEGSDSQDLDTDDETDSEGGNRRRRRRGGRRRRKPGGEEDSEGSSSTDQAQGSADTGDSADQDGDSEGSSGTRRRRRRRRAGDEPDGETDIQDKTVTRVRKPRAAEDEIAGLTGSTRLEAKKQRRREGREAGRRRAPIASEAEFLARREAVSRVMVIRQRKDLTQIAVLEDKVLVEHYVARESQTSLIGNVYLGRVQNVLPSMEAAFIDIGKGRNAVIYAGEVNWDALGGKGGQSRKIESVLKSGQSVLVQVTKDPVGHKGARLTSQVSLPGRFVVYVPDGSTSGISRKLPDTERTRLKTLLKEIVPSTAGVIVRTAAEGASEEELMRDVQRLTARWEDISSKVAGGNAPHLLYAEPDLTLKVVRDLFTEDFGKLVVSGEEAWGMVDEYVEHVAPELADRLEKYDGRQDVFAAYRIDEQIAKGLDRKVWLPSGGSLVIDRTEAMTVVDVNTGKFTGSGGNLEETVTRNNLEAAEEIVRQLRLRDIGGIIVVDFIDMVLESNRDLVLRRMVECLGRDRTRHQVAEVTSLGLVQMTRKRIGTGLLEAFSENCEHCQGRGLLVHHEPVEPSKQNDDDASRNQRGVRNRGRGGDSKGSGADTSASTPTVPSPKDVAAVAKPENADKPPLDEVESQSADALRPGSPHAELDQPDAVQPDSAATASTPDRPSPVEPDPVEAAPVDHSPIDGSPVEPAASVGSSYSSSSPGAQLDVDPRPVRERKRSARRAQGPAASASADDSSTGVMLAEALPLAAGDATPERGPDAQDDDTAPPESAAPRIVTSVRRRGASRPAGPPQGAGAAANAGTAELHAVHSQEGSGDDDAVADAQPHVPVKKKGSRKR